MPKLVPSDLGMPVSLVDLAEVERDRRAGTWNTVVRDAFPSLSVKFFEAPPAVGSIMRTHFGSGELFEINSPPVDVMHNPSSFSHKGSAGITLMVQSKGSMQVRQAGVSTVLSVGDLCVVDETRSFRLVGEDNSRILFLRMPRAVALSRYPPLEKVMFASFPSDTPGAHFLVDTLQHLSLIAGSLNEIQKHAMMNSMVHMLGVAEPFANFTAAPDWRVRRALDYIELNLSVAGLTAEAVAEDQRISRRRLDQLMLDAFGQSIAGHLWKRRLEQAASDLRDPNRTNQSIAQIAFANGFEDAAHFTRAFKRRYSVTPRHWRAN